MVVFDRAAFRIPTVPAGGLELYGQGICLYL